MNNPGWSCPKCGSVYAPWVKRREECPKVRESAANTACLCPIDRDGSVVHRRECRLAPRGATS